MVRKIIITHSEMTLEEMVKKGFLTRKQAEKERICRRKMREHGKKLQELASGLDKETRWNILSGK